MSATRKAQQWESMRLDYLGRVGDLMQGNLGSRADGPGSNGFNKGNGRQ
jgi:hypothetical protein